MSIHSETWIYPGWGWLLVTGLIWLIGFSIIKYSLRISKETQKNQRVLDYAPKLTWLGGGIAGFILEIIVSLIIGIFVKLLPWWFSKTIGLLTGCWFFYLGILALKYV
ncbi:hypothetical protein LSG31_06975 [Fodinisporobacter ferrooxydans]|uniref:Uncharacterized protein n=1 Tax=Fodinisporobacter ferrooxydans TaxID=2901836 RepID=A0ABY4CRC8_9BACL|nr:hypothetical protein LSG31_06975 [Alicyclobacillaceae bacterium MYW30-H2]